MFGTTLGVQEMVVIFFVALVLFGPKKLPELGKTIGKALTEFRRHSNDLKATFEREMHNLERETEPIHQAATSAAEQIHNQMSIDPYQHWLPEGETTATHQIAAGETSQEAQETHQPSETVGASEVASAESTGATEVAVIEGTVPRSKTATPEAAAQDHAPETPQHS